MKLINWNVNNSGPRRIDLQIDWLLGEAPDLMVLSEVNCRHLHLWKRLLSARDFWTSMPRQVTETRKGALIASRLPGRPYAPLFDHPMPQCSVSAAIHSPRARFDMHAVYARADGGRPRDKSVKASILRAVADGVAMRSGTQLIAGDFNSPQAELCDRIVTFSERRNASGEWRLPVRSKSIDQVMFKHNAELAIRRPRQDMVDAFVERAAADSPRASWRHYRLDHIILSRDLLPASVRYQGVDRTLSDHAAMIAVW